MLATERATSCCGLLEVCGLGNVYGAPVKSIVRRGRAYFATTIPRQRKEIKALKKLKFRRVGSWRNSNTGNQITLWVRNIVAKRKKRK